ncbi:MAG: lytic transglycosylase domain-containing protein [Aestuariivirga sp.]|nr:lytic transglycosylase domain-containing protein [Aestuariivirga sp.]
MQNRVLGRLVIGSLLVCTALAGATAVFTPESAVAAKQATSPAVHAIELALKGHFSDAGPLAKRSGDEAAVKLVELLYLRDHWDDAGYNRIMNFLNAAPKWPLADMLMKRAEQSLYKNREPADRILAHFVKRQPISTEGRLALARANIASGNSQAAREIIRKVWSDPTIDAAFEKSIASEFGSLLDADDHKRRMWQMVYAQETNAAIRNSKRLGGDYQNAAKVAQELLRNVAGADKKYDRLPAAMRGQLAMKYALVRYLRKLERYSKARTILATIPADAAVGAGADAWWVERRIVVRHSVGIQRRDTVKAAYQIAKAHGSATGSNAVEGEFLAGWIALRWLKDPETALGHFTKLEKIAESRTEKARAHYWMGRSYGDLGDKAKAREVYARAAEHSTIYYGQLAREHVGLGKVPKEIKGGQPSAAAKASIERDEVARAFNLMVKANATSSLNMFVWSLASRFNSVDEMNAVAALTKRQGGTTMALRLAKAAAQRNVDIDDWAYPTKALPSWKQMGKPVEASLVYGLSRQESEFDPRAGSKAGAQGLMQIMPGTAKLITKQYRMPYEPAKLMDDPAYNVKLGAAHLGDLIADYNGSYILTLVAYNAGPRRVKEWVAEYGDPRGGSVDPIDWVESIPFQETRQYVQKVLQNTQVYRARLAPGTMRSMTADLKRGGRAEINVAANEDKDTERCAGGSIGALIASCD